MRNLIIFIRRYFNFFLFLLLEVICLSLVFSYNGYQNTAYLNSANAISGYLFGKYNTIRSYFHLKSVNDSLSIQNARLLNRLPANFTAPDTSSGIKTDSNGQRQYEYFPAKVVNNSVNRPLNYITIHRGSDQDITAGMGVTGPRGIVGIVRQVSKNYAVVMSLLHKNTRISAMLPRTGNFGSVQWNIENLDPRYGILTDIPKNVPVYKGDTVTTSGYSAIFPRGLTIGYIDRVTESESSNFHVIRIKFATDFRTLQYVYVIKNLNAAEQHQVEATVPHE